MALRIHLLSSNALPQLKLVKHPNLPTTNLVGNRAKAHIACTSDNLSDGELASDLAAEVAKINTHLLLKEEAMRKSRDLLFTELCQYMDLQDKEVKKKWTKMSEEEKWVLVKGFVNEWDSNFHPLSARSVVEMVEEYMRQEKPPSLSSPSALFPGLKRMMGFS